MTRSLSAIAAAIAFVLLMPMRAHSQGLDAEPGSYGTIHKVALISAIGTHFTLREYGGWDGKTGSIDISSWKIDDIVNTTLRKYLGGRFTFVDTTFDVAGILALPTRFMRESKTTDYLKTVPNPGVDAFILIHPAEEYELPGPEGLAMDYNLQTVLWANFEFDVIDAHTFKYIAKAQARVRTHDGEEARYSGFPLMKGFWGGVDVPLSAAKVEYLRRDTEALMQTALVETMRDLQFGVALPPVGDHSIAPPPTAIDASDIKSVAVMSAIGDGLNLVESGDILSKGGAVQLPISDWNFDAEAERIAQQALSPKISVRTVPIDRNALAKARLRVGAVPVITGLAPTSDVDAYVLILKQSSPDPNQVGLVELSHSWMGRTTQVSVNYGIVLVDAHSLHVIKGLAGGTSAKFKNHSPMLEVDNSLWPGRSGIAPPETLAKLRTTMSSIVSDSIPETLYRMGLGVEAPPAPVTAAAK
jgi:hypothetical protein